MSAARWVATAAALAMSGPGPVHAQTDTTSAGSPLYDRPFVLSGNSASIGGYLEGSVASFVEEGVDEGVSFELRRFNIFLYSSISRRLRFISELEFEHGTEEIALETAQVDLVLDPRWSLRAGILLPPIGYLNQNHDSPRWDFVDRPLVTTELIPSTLSEVGVGAYGRFGLGGGLLSWEAYLTNGLQDGVLDNELGRTHLASGRADDAFGEDNNGSPALSGRLAFAWPERGSVGVSYYGGYYNRFRMEGVEVDRRRWLEIMAIDGQAHVSGAEVRMEVARARVDVPAGLRDLFGERQIGGHLDVVVPVARVAATSPEPVSIALGLRGEYVDYHRGTFASTGRPIRDDVTALVLGLSARPAEGTVVRLNYRYQWTRDFVGNPTTRRAGWQIGLATYF